MIILSSIRKEELGIKNNRIWREELGIKNNRDPILMMRISIIAIIRGKVMLNVQYSFLYILFRY